MLVRKSSGMFGLCHSFLQFTTLEDKHALLEEPEESLGSKVDYIYVTIKSGHVYKNGRSRHSYF
jgi:hypothetical protein